jgi:hypothetical protein
MFTLRIGVVGKIAVILAGAATVGCGTPASDEHGDSLHGGPARETFELRAGTRSVILSGGSEWRRLGSGVSHVVEFDHELGRIQVFLEQRRNPAEAVRRLEQIAAEWPEESVATSLDGHPAIERFREAIVSPPSFASAEDLLALRETVPTLTLATAEDDVVLRLEASLRAPIDDAARRALAGILEGASLGWARGRPSLDELEPQQHRLPEQPPSGSDGAIVPLDRTAPELLPLLAETEAGFDGRINSGGGVDAEIEVAVSDDARHIVVVNNSRDFTTSNTYGQSFRATSTLTGGPPANGDPSIAWAQSGAFYFAYIAFPNGTAASGGVTGCSTGIHTSTDNGQSFGFRGHAFVSPVTGLGVSFPDQEHIAADRVNPSSGGGDQVYSVWRDFAETTPGPTPNNCCSLSHSMCPAMSTSNLGGATPRIVCSTDGATTFGAAVAVGSGDFARVTVGPDGSVYVVYRSGDNIMLNKFSSCDSGLVQQAGMPVTVASDAYPVNCGSTNGIPGLDRCNSGTDGRSPTVAVDESDANHIYVAYAANDASNSSSANENVFLQDSTDGGQTWTRPRQQLNTSTTGHRFMPWVCATGGTAFVSWYDMRAGVGGASNDLTEFYGATAALDGAGDLAANSEFAISQVADPLCASGWPAAPRSSANSENCSVQPQLAGACAGGGGSCDFSDCSGGPVACPGGVCPGPCTCGDSNGDNVQDACQTDRGIPKYGDYNGAACAGGRFYAAWASRTAPAGDPQPTSIDVFFRCPPDTDDVNGTFADNTNPFFESVPPDINATTCNIGSIGQAVAFDACGDGPPVVTNDAPVEFEATDTTVTWTATDAASNTAIATQLVSITDGTPPTVTAPPNVTTSVCQTSNMITVGTATGTDDCDDDLEIRGFVVSTNGVNLPAPIEVIGGQVTLGVGTHTIRWTAFDGTNTTVAFQTVAVGSTIQASSSFLVEDGARVLVPGGLGAAVLNSGTGQTSIGNGSLSGSVLSAGPARVLHKATVQGSVVSGVSVFVEPDATVTGTTSVAPVVLPVLPTLPAFPAPAGGPITVNSGTSSPPPGSYSNVTVNGGTLIFAAGDYFIRNLTFNNGTTIRASASTRVFVQTSLVYRSPFRATVGSAIQPVFLGFAGLSTVIEAPFDGTLVAPNASVEFGIGSGLTFTGSFFARTLKVRPASRLVCLAGTAPPQPPTPATCPDGVHNGTETDVDCGGAMCPKCATGDTCNVGSDCLSGSCTGGTCAVASGITAAISITTDWGSGYCAVLHTTNAAALPTTNWTSLVNVGASSIYASWNGLFSGSSGSVTVSPAYPWNRAIAPSTTNSSIGFCANRLASGVLPAVVSASATF